MNYAFAMVVKHWKHRTIGKRVYVDFNLEKSKSFFHSCETLQIQCESTTYAALDPCMKNEDKIFFNASINMENKTNNFYCDNDCEVLHLVDEFNKDKCFKAALDKIDVCYKDINVEDRIIALVTGDCR